MNTGLLTPNGNGWRVRVRLTPKGGRNAITGIGRTAEGHPVVKARVTAAPEDGKANAALIRLLSRVWRLPKSAFEIISGATSRSKVVRIEMKNAPAAIENWAAAQKDT